jgi:hypothetical protein
VIAERDGSTVCVNRWKTEARHEETRIYPRKNAAVWRMLTETQQKDCQNLSQVTLFRQIIGLPSDRRMN